MAVGRKSRFFSAANKDLTWLLLISEFRAFCAPSGILSTYEFHKQVITQPFTVSPEVGICPHSGDF